MNKSKLLIIDDNSSVAESFKDILELFGYESDCIFDWELVHDSLLREHYEIIFMDINLKNMSGVTLLNTLKNSKTLKIKNTIFVAVSGHSEFSNEGIEANKIFDHYFQKPISLDDLENLFKTINLKTLDIES